MTHLFRICVFAALFPYVKTTPFASDIQPHFAVALCVCIAVALATRGRAPFSDFALFASFTLGGSAFLLGGRVDAVALAILPIAIAVFSRIPRDDLITASKAALICYCAGLMLELLAPAVLDILVSNRRAAHARGFTSFTSEPSYLGLIGLAFCVLFMLGQQKRSWICTSGLLCLASGSLTAIAPLFAILLIRMMRPAQAHVFLCIVSLGALFTIIAAQTDSRIGLLLSAVWADPSAVLFDESISNRIARAFAPIAAAYQSGFMPQPFPAAGEIEVTFGFLAETADTQIERLSSITTVLIYVYGLASVPLILGYLHMARAPFYVMLALGYFCITNISINTPYLYLLLSLPLAGHPIQHPHAHQHPRQA